MKTQEHTREILRQIKVGHLAPQEGARLLRNLQQSIVEPNTMQQAPASAEGACFQDIAVIGMSGQFPGAANCDEFWDNLKTGIDSISEIPDDRWPLDGFYDPNPQTPNRSYSKWGGFLSNIDRFDPRFFNISPREAELMDPQQRLFLQEAWSALEDAGYAPEQLYNQKCGVFVGCATGDYENNLNAHNIPIEAYTFMGNATSILSARISYILNLSGPSITVDTACSSSLVAIHMACESLWCGTSHMALAGGVAVLTTGRFHVLSSKTNMLSSDGRCKAFDNSANGFVPAEGAGVLVLKPLQKAIQDGDHVYAVIKGSAINQDGKTNGITAPSAPSQTAVERAVYDTFQISPETLSYIEAHGTGTKLGDPIEIHALTDSFRAYTKKKQFCAIGSVKTNIGHALTASGVAGVIKLLLCLKHQQLPPSLLLQQENEHIDFKNSPFYVNTQLQPWVSTPGSPRRAAISSFGFSGTNAHLVIEEYAPPLSLSSSVAALPQLLVVSAKNLDRLQAYAKKIANFIKKHTGSDGSQLSLENIAYTLQVGRDAMEERFAMVVSELTEAETKFRQLAQKATKIEGCCSGNIRTGEENILDQQITLAIQEKNLPELARLWVQGGTVRWQKLHNGFRRQRLSLPTYPFADERYWIPQLDRQSTIDVQQSTNHNLHPLLDRNTSTLQEQQYSVRLTGQEFFLTDHVVAGQKTLPGVAYLEMARASGELAGSQPVRKISNVVWARPVVVGGSPQDISISLYPEQRHVTFEVVALEEGGKRRVYAQGKLEYDDLGDKAAEALNVNQIIQRCSVMRAKKECYTLFKEHGLDYGPGFQPIQTLYNNKTEALALMKLPNQADHDFDLFDLHPSLLDGALQTVFGLLHDDTAGMSYLPFALGEVQILKTIPKVCYAHTTVAASSTDDPAVKKFHVTIVDEAGQLLIAMKDFSLRAFQAQQTAPETLFYRAAWEAAPLPLPPAQSNISSPILLLDRDDSRYHEFKEQISTDMILATPGVEYQQQETDRYTLRPTQRDDYRRLIVSLSEQNRSPRTIIHLWSQSQFSPETSSVADSLYSILYLCQVLLEQKSSELCHVIFAYLESDEALQPQYAAMSGFFKTLEREYPKILFSTVALSDLSQASKQLTAELKTDSSGDIRYRDNQRSIKRMQAVKSLSEQVGDSLLKKHGVYLITGGAGGLGGIFAEYLARQYQARIVLTGRSELSPERQNIIQGLSDNGAEVIYMQSDVGQLEEVKALISRIKNQFQQIDGILHSAGVLRDAILLKKTPEDVEEVLVPKVRGTLNLDKATQQEDLDFFILFSSIASVLGNAGQTDYAYANSFLDHFAAWREQLCLKQQRSGKTISINWPMWRDGGMHVDSQIEEWMNKTLGISLLNTAAGVKAFERSLSLQENRMVVVSGERRKIEQAFGIMQPSSASKGRNGVSSVKDDGQILEQIQRHIIDIAASILRMETSDVELTENINTYGFDSISFTEFANRLNDEWRLNLTPAIFFEYTSLDEFAKFLHETYRDDIGGFYQSGQDVSNETSSIFKLVEDPSLPQPITLKSRFQIGMATQKGTFSSSSEPIAIIGRSGVMPQSENLDIFWQHLIAGDDLITEVPTERWDWRAYYGDPKKEANKTYAKWGGFMPDVDKFDAMFFGISPREAELMDPQQRLILQTVWHTIEDAGYTASYFDGSDMGVFIGVSTGDYHELVQERTSEIEAYHSTGRAYSVLANRISFLFNVHGPSEPIDTACSSALVAIHRAVEAIRNGNCQTAIAGGVNVIVRPGLTLSFSKAGMLSPDGRCKTFDKSANGYVRGEGVGALLLKPLSQAEADGDHIYAIIRGTAENHGGRAASLTAPNPSAQAQLLIKAYQQAGIDPATVSYIEAHGTGTSLGDPIEINGLKQAFAELYKQCDKALPDTPHCGIGSVKTNIGHLEAAAGMAGLLKVILAMEHETLPGHLHFHELNPYISLEKSPFYIVHENRPWKRLTNGNGVTAPRRAGVSSFGFGGANAHVVLEEYSSRDVQRDRSFETAHVIPLSAKSNASLTSYAHKMIQFLAARSSHSNTSFISSHPDLSSSVLPQIQQQLLELVSRILQVKATELDTESAFEDYGLDAVGVNECVRQLKETYHFNITPMVFVQYSSIEALASYLSEELREAENRKEWGRGDGDGFAASSGNASLSLVDLAYTLQTGREAMEERVAFVVSSLHELQETLQQYTRGEKNIPHCYRGNVKKNSFPSDILLKGKAGETFLQALFEERDMNAFAKLWVNGIDIDWRLLHSDCQVRRIALPTYPFARHRYWIPQHKQQAAEASQKSAPHKLHPLVERNISTLQEERFSTTMTGQEFYLADHIVMEQKILPGAAYLEMARSAGEFASEQVVRRLTSVVWSNPLIVSDADREVIISVYPEDRNMTFKVSSVDANQQQQTHAQGKLSTYPVSTDESNCLELEAIKGRCSTIRRHEECYHEFRRYGLHYGTSFQTIQVMYSNVSEALSYIALPDALIEQRHDFVIHPSLLDGALQTVLGLMDILEPDTPFLPFTLGELECLRPLTKNCYVYIKSANGATNAYGSGRTFTIQIADEEGKVLVRMKDFEIRAMLQSPNFPKQTTELLSLLRRLENGEVDVELVKQTLES